MKILSCNFMLCVFCFSGATQEAPLTNVVGRFYELEMYEGTSPSGYSLAGYILSKNNWFIDMSVITHSSTKTYASNYLSMVMNSLTIHP